MNKHFRIILNDGILKRFLDDGKNMSPSDRGEMLTKAEDMINTHREIAIEGQTAVNILCIILKKCCNFYGVHKYFKIIILNCNNIVLVY